MESIYVIKTVITGIGATLLMDIWSLFQKQILRVPPLNYALVGRWILSLPEGTFFHSTIASTPRVKGEKITGWVFHYLTGIAFAFVPFIFNGGAWLREPSLTMGLLAGLLTLFAPFLLLQPAFGFGIAASRTPRPWVTRLMSALTHLAYGFGLYVAALMMSA
ncbi:DUF2938 domain-containing protein [Leclercia adecarboxylata]|uniref:DUF2938 domain-containing protein n=1 Tax=Leclercia adecarboxylata TaxID=83655 RepID=UPI00159BDA41|nr:DUF2938 domain-containing protein [Leclercia adecarboxylata]